jgi:hypothetical protein
MDFQLPFLCQDNQRQKKESKIEKSFVLHHFALNQNN